MPRDSTTQILAGLHSAAGCRLCSQESVLSATHADGRPFNGFGNKTQRHWRIDVAAWIIIFGMAACRLLAHRDSGHGLDGFIFNVCDLGKLHSLATPLDPCARTLACPCRAILHVCQPSCHFCARKMTASPECWYDPLPWPQVASEATVTFVVAALEVLTRLERCPEAHGGGGARNLDIGVI